MYKQLEKTKKNKSKTVDNSVAQKKNNDKQGVGLVDNRPEFMSQRKLQEIGNSVALGTKTQLKSKEHSYGCGCPSCTNSHQPLQAKKILSSGIVQRVTTVSIEDKFGKNASGQSGNESSTRRIFNKWPALSNSFESHVHSVDMPVLDEDGKETGGTYPRNRYMCAEPNALSSLLNKYDAVEHPLNNDWLADIEFPELAIDNKTGQKIKPCPVCSQWVSDIAPMKIKGLDGGSFTNETQQEHKKELARQEHLRQEQEAEKAQEKERKKQERQGAQNAQEAKLEVIQEIQKIDAMTIFKLIDYIPDDVATEWGIYKKKKEVNMVNLKGFTDDCISRWIAGLSTTDVNVIKLYKKFKDDGGFKNDFNEWAKRDLV